MKSVPNIISTKDLSYLEDILNWNFILIKKINHFLDEVKDEDIYKKLEKANNELVKDYNEIKREIIWIWKWRYYYNEILNTLE